MIILRFIIIRAATIHHFKSLFFFVCLFCFLISSKNCPLKFLEHKLMQLLVLFWLFQTLQSQNIFNLSACKTMTSKKLSQLRSWNHHMLWFFVDQPMIAALIGLYCWKVFKERLSRLHVYHPHCVTWILHKRCDKTLCSLLSQLYSEFPARSDDGAAPVSSDLVPLRLPAAPRPAVCRYVPPLTLKLQLGSCSKVRKFPFSLYIRCPGDSPSVAALTFFIFLHFLTSITAECIPSPPRPGLLNEIIFPGLTPPLYVCWKQD